MRVWKLPQTLAHKVVQFSSCPILLKCQQPKTEKAGQERGELWNGVAISVKVGHSDLIS